MNQSSSVIAVFSDHKTAEAAVKKLADAGITMGNLSIVGKGYHTDEKVIGFYNMGDRINSGAPMARSGAASGAGSPEASSSPFR